VKDIYLLLEDIVSQSSLFVNKIIVIKFIDYLEHIVQMKRLSITSFYNILTKLFPFNNSF